MQPDSGRQDNFDHFEEKYSRPRSDAVRQVERAVLGHEIGLDGYTTVDQAHALCDGLRLNDADRLLDLGSGRGWPGFHIAECRSCSLVSTDVPLGALVQARTSACTRAIRDRSQFVVADGRALPFLAGYFHAIAHADVFC
jgi:ubiquinone/menaquinone biosynthesis C-methylase UbiE